MSGGAKSSNSDLEEVIDMKPPKLSASTRTLEEEILKEVDASDPDEGEYDHDFDEDDDEYKIIEKEMKKESAAIQLRSNQTVVSTVSPLDQIEPTTEDKKETHSQGYQVAMPLPKTVGPSPRSVLPQNKMTN